MSIQFRCSGCSKKLRVRDDLVGRKIRCPDCEEVLRVPTEEDEEQDDLNDLDSPPRSKSTKATSSRRESIPAAPSKKSKKPKRSKQESGGGGVPVWVIALGSSVAGLLFLGGLGYAIITLAKSGGGRKAAAQEYIITEATHPKASFKVEWEMPAGWTQESDIENGLWPWAKMSGQGQQVRLTSNKSITAFSQGLTGIGGAAERLKGAHTFKVEKLKSEYLEYEEGPQALYEGTKGQVVWSEFEYKGLVAKGYGIRCTINGPRFPCSLTMETSQSARDKWRPVLLRIAESVRYVQLGKNGKVEEEGGNGEIAGGDAQPDNAPPGDGDEQEPQGSNDGG